MRDKYIVKSYSKIHASPRTWKLADIIMNHAESSAVAEQILNQRFSKLKFEDYANYMGQPENYRILHHFISMLGSLPKSLLSSLSVLSNHVYFVAESQNLDRILEELSRQWVKQNPNTHWRTSTKFCHIIMFGLVILNSAFHNQNAKILALTEPQFIHNTMGALRLEPDYQKFKLHEHESEICTELRDYYNALKITPLPICKADWNALQATSVISFKRKLKLFRIF